MLIDLSLESCCIDGRFSTHDEACVYILRHQRQPRFARSVPQDPSSFIRKHAYNSQERTFWNDVMAEARAAPHVGRVGVGHRVLVGNFREKRKHLSEHWGSLGTKVTG